MQLGGVARRARDQGGFTLVEVTVAGALLVIGLLGGVSVFDSSRRESATGERQQLGALQVQEEIERLRDVPYAELEVDPDPAHAWQPPPGPVDPTSRVTSGTPSTFRVGPSSDEELVIGANGEGIRAYSSFPLAAGDSTLTAYVYRFVSWRDEECPVADLSGVIGPLEGLTDTSTSLLGGLLSAGSTLNTLLGPLLGILNPVIGNRLDSAKATLTGVQSGLAELVAAIEALDEIDPCDADVETLNELQDTLEPLNPLLTELNSRINAYHAGCIKVLGVIVSCPGTGSSLYTNLNSTITSLENSDYETAFAELTESLSDLGLADHTHNTKRVTVAVVLDPRTGSGPIKPVWATSVISDPSEGLLAGP